MTRHDRAAAMIETRLITMEAGDDSVQLASEVGMAIEMAYSLNAIDCDEYQRYVSRRHSARTQHIRNDLHRLGVSYDNATCANAH